MVETEGVETSSIPLAQVLPGFNFADPFIFAIEVITGVLALVVALYSYRFYRLSGLTYIFGLVMGFSFLAVSEFFNAAYVWMEFDAELFNMFFWMRLIASSYGFSLMALSYYYKGREEGRSTLIPIVSLSMIPILITVAVISLTEPRFDFPPYQNVDQYFSVLNLVILAYTFRGALTSILEHGRKDFIYIPLAFAVLWIGQYSALAYRLEGPISMFIGQYVAEFIGLLIFVAVLYRIMMKGRKVETSEELK